MSPFVILPRALGRIGRAVLENPARVVLTGFALAVVVGTLLLMLPSATTAEGSAPFMVAVFTTVSAVCVTGLVTVDTATYWTPMGQAVILGLIQVGGLGVMTLATLLALLVRGRIRMRERLAAQAETHALNPGDVRAVLVRVLLTSLAIEAVIALALTARFRAAYDESLHVALWHGVFHSVSAFNNAGFALWSGNLVPAVADLYLIGPITAGVVLGGLGFPVVAEIMRHGRGLRQRIAGRRAAGGYGLLEQEADGAAPGSLSARTSMAHLRWSTHARLTMVGTVALLAIGTVTFLVFEWRNAGTLGPLAPWHKVLAAWANGGVFPRTAGFNSIDYGLIRPETEAITTVLMFIGGGSAGTAGGIKVTTFLLLAYVIRAEVQGREHVVIGGRRIPQSTWRQALTVALLGVGLVVTATIGILILTRFSFDQVLFEVVSAFSTVGLSLGITSQMPPGAQVILMFMMFLGRVGPITAASALALRTRRDLVRHPEERPIVG